MKILVNASNMHSGGGKVLLIDFLSSARKIKNLKFYIFIDPRFDYMPYKSDNVKFEVVSKIKRLSVCLKISGLSSENDLIIYLGNIPPFISHKCKVILLQSNRYLVEKNDISDNPWNVQMRIIIERWAFRFFSKNADYIIVQSLSMKKLLYKMGFTDNVVKVMPYKNNEQYDVSVARVQVSNIFLYVASGDPNKNHKNLVSAWRILSNDGIRPTLYLTIDANTPMHKYVIGQIQKWNLRIQIKSELPRDQLLKLYREVGAVIYPSYLESYGLPLVEALKFDIPVVASELDFVRDILDPVETFDPHSPRSICRAVKRYLGINEKRTEVITAEEFIKRIIDYA